LVMKSTSYPIVSPSNLIASRRVWKRRRGNREVILIVLREDAIGHIKRLVFGDDLFEL
jgi:hypothetical protein